MSSWGRENVLRVRKKKKSLNSRSQHFPKNFIASFSLVGSRCDTTKKHFLVPTENFPFTFFWEISIETFLAVRSNEIYCSLMSEMGVNLLLCVWCLTKKPQLLNFQGIFPLSLAAIQTISDQVSSTMTWQMHARCSHRQLNMTFTPRKQKKTSNAPWTFFWLPSPIFLIDRDIDEWLFHGCRMSKAKQLENSGANNSSIQWSILIARRSIPCQFVCGPLFVIRYFIRNRDNDQRQDCCINFYIWKSN